MSLSQLDYQNLMYAMRSVPNAQLWTRQPGLEYWMQPGTLAQGVGTHSDGVLALTNNGWVNTGTILGVAGSGADLLTSSDKGTPTAFAIDTAADLLNSPALFGDYNHGIQAAALAGRLDLPTQLIYDSWSQFAVIVTASDTSGHGFVEAGGAASVAADALAVFVSDGTSFKLRSGAATSAALMAADTLIHRFRVVLDVINQLAYAFIDDMATALGSIALETDLFPCSVGAGVLTGTGANFINWGPTRVRYAWNGWVA